MGKLCNMVCFIHNKKKTGCMLRCSQYTAGLLLLCPCFFDKFTRRIRISLLLRILLFPYHRSGRASRPADLQKLFRERYLRPDPHFRIINIATRLTYIFFHLFSSVRNLSCPCPGYFPKHHLIVIAYIISDKNAISL